MSVTSQTQIQNSALSKIGAESILSENDNSNRARLVKAAYPIRRDALLRSHPWNFAVTYVELAAISPTPSDIFEYDYVYQLPSDCLRVIGTDLADLDDWEEIAGKRIACNESTLKVKYISKVTDVSKYDDTFCELLAFTLAVDICYAITQSTAMKESLEKDFDRWRKNAQTFDAQVGSTKQVEANEWLAFRRY
jgi:hypothetical protein